MDEMKIKSGLAFSKSSGKLVGFCDLGTVNSELSEGLYSSQVINPLVPQNLNHIACLYVTSAVQMVRSDETRETRLFIRMVDQFFDCLNVKSPWLGVMQRKDYRLLYNSPTDHRFKVYA